MPKVYTEKIYHIILVNHSKQLRDLYCTHSEKLVNSRFKKMLDENEKNVVFPIKFNNLKHQMVEAEYELVIIKYDVKPGEKKTRIRNDFGKFVNYETSDENWIVCDRAPYKMEESFWVYGYNPKLQRKDFNWIYKNFFEKDSKNKYAFKTLQLYNNKLLIDASGKLDMVICKNKPDAIRLYNQIEELCNKNKFKYIIFGGDIRYSKYKRDWIKKIMDLTGWNIHKVKRTSTRD